MTPRQVVFGASALSQPDMSTEFSDKSKHQPESALAGISENILAGLTAPIELFTGKDKGKELAAFRESAKDYLKEGLKTTAMFMRGKTGLFGTIVTSALDEWKPTDTKHAALDLTLGTAKGAALTFVFRKTAMVDSNIKFFGSALNVPLNAAKLGLFSRIPSVGLTRSTWVDESDQFNASRTGNILLASTASIGTDITAGIVTHGLLKGTNRITDNAVAKSPMLSTVLTGSGFGMSNGAAQEIMRQQEQQGEFNPLKLDYWKIGQSALLQGAIDSAAAIPGGHQAEHEALKTFNSLSAGAEKAKKVPSFKRELPKSDREKANTEDGRPDNCSMCLTKDDIHTTAITPIINASTLENFRRFDKLIENKRFKQVYDAEKGNVVQRLDDFMSYIPKDHRAVISVPREYNELLKDERLARTIEEESNSPQNPSREERPALPEDLIPCLDALPNSNLVKSIYLHNEKRAWDIKDGPSEFGYAIADANAQGHLNYYKHPRSPMLLRTNTNHEFAHLVHFTFREADSAYKHACELENALANKDVNARDYATKNTLENFAVHFGEELLDASPEKLLKVAQYAPIRLAVLAKALKETLTEIPQAKISLHREQFLKRVELLEETLIPQVVNSLLKDIAKKPDSIVAKVRTLAYIGEPKHAQSLIKLASTVKDEQSASDLLFAGTRLCEADRKQQLDFLLNFSEKTPFDYVRQLALSHFSESEIKTHFIPHTVRQSKNAKSLYVRSLNDLSEWHQASGNADKREHYAQMAYEASKDAPTPDTLTSLDIIIDCLMDRRSYAEAESYMRKSVELSKILHGEISAINRDTVDRLSGYLLNEKRYEEALPLLVRQFQIDKALSKKGEQKDRNFYFLEMNYDLKNLIEISELFGNTKAQVHWLRTFNKHLDGQILPDLHLEIVDKLLSQLPIGDGREVENLWQTQKYLHNLKANLAGVQVKSNAL